MDLEWNSAEADKEKLKELWQTFRTGAIGIANDAQRLADFVAEVVADDDRKDDLIGALNAGGISLQDVQSKISGAKDIRDAIVVEFPNAIAEE